MKMIIGLGNTGPHYSGTRHNVGFAMCDALAQEFGLQWQQKEKFKALVAEGVVDGEKTILVKPTTFYNNVGEAAQAIKQFYKLENTDILALHDELALPFGTVRARQEGSDAGNNGIKSLIAHLGPDFARIRVGIANQHSPQTDAADFVLSHFTAEEQKAMSVLAKHVAELCRLFIHPARDLTPQSARVIKE